MTATLVLSEFVTLRTFCLLLYAGPLVPQTHGSVEVKFAIGVGCEITDALKLDYFTCLEVRDGRFEYASRNEVERVLIDVV